MNPDTREWCNGLPLQETRPLSAEERAELAREVQVGSKAVWGWGCGFSLLMWGLLAISIAIFSAVAATWSADFNSRYGGAINAAFVGLVIFLVLAPGLGWLRARDWSRWRREARADLEAGQVSVYGDAIEFYAPKEWLLEERPLEKQPSEERPLEEPVVVERERRLEVMAASRRIWTRDGERIAGHQSAPQVEVAAVPDASRRALAWTTPLPATAVREVGEGLNQRELSPSEREEIESYAGRVWKPFLWPAIGFSAWVSLPLLLHFAFHEPIKIEPMAYILGALALWMDWNLARTVLFSRRLKRDAASGIAWVLRFSPDPDSPDIAMPQNAEVLPLSRAEWTRWTARQLAPHQVVIGKVAQKRPPAIRRNANEDCSKATRLRYERALFSGPSIR